MRTIRLNVTNRRDIVKNYRDLVTQDTPARGTGLSDQFEQAVLNLYAANTSVLALDLQGTDVFSYLKKGEYDYSKGQNFNTPDGHFIHLGSFRVPDTCVAFNKLEGFEELIAQFKLDVDSHLHAELTTIENVYEEFCVNARDLINVAEKHINGASSTKGLLEVWPEAITFFPTSLVEEMNSPAPIRSTTGKVIQPPKQQFTI